jgi:DNA repair protein RadC
MVLQEAQVTVEQRAHSIQGDSSQNPPIQKFPSIKDWSSQDRPREKLLLKGKAALSDAELLSILLCCGTPAINVLDVAKGVLRASDDSLFKLANLSIKELMKMKGIGRAKAITIVAALELGRRRKEHDAASRPKMITSRDAYNMIAPELTDLPHEEFWVLLLDRANRMIRKVQVSRGGVSGTVADPKIIFKTALDELACSIVLAHNHPSGNLSASKADLELTQKIVQAGKLLDIQVLDHIIVAGQKYFSFADEGML